MCFLSFHVQFCRNLVLTKSDNVDWKLMYFTLKKHYPTKEQYGDTLHFCKHCSILFWKVNKHTCNHKHGNHINHREHLWQNQYCSSEVNYRLGVTLEENIKRRNLHCSKRCLSHTRHESVSNLVSSLYQNTLYFLGQRDKSSIIIWYTQRKSQRLFGPITHPLSHWYLPLACRNPIFIL